jgi:hypothetical protein
VTEFNKNLRRMAQEHMSELTGIIISMGETLFVMAMEIN